MRKHIAKYFSDSKIIELLEFPVLFLGAGAQDIPALYSLMNYADIVGGTWYPMGGMHLIAKAMEAVAKEQGAHFHYGEEVISISCNGDQINGIKTSKGNWEGDFYLSGADYHHTENLLPKALQQYDENYWQKRTMAPSALIYYVGLNTKMPDTVPHHTLFFDADFERHSEEIYDRPQMPTDPLFYLCAPSKTDSSVAPAGCENLFFLIPTAPGLDNDTEEVRQQYFDMLCTRLEKHYGMDIRPHIVYQRSFSVKDFKQDYNSFKGNAYGLANTLNQTAILKPRLVSKKVRNLAYCGQLTVPGPGVPPALVSGEVAANYIHQKLKRTNH
jgi:phytoene desaturase